MRNFLIFLLMPSILLAGEFKVNRQAAIRYPADYIDRVSLRGPDRIELQDSASFNAGNFKGGKRIVILTAEPIHWDSAGTWKRLRFDETVTTGEYDRAIRSGKWDIEYSTTKPGKMRFSRKKGWISFDPAFKVAQVGVEYNITARGLKEILHLNESSPTRLAWGYDYNTVHEKEAKGKGRIKNILAQTVAELGELSAVDAAGKVVPLTATYTADSLIVQLNTSGAVWPILLDPSVNDTVIAATSGSMVRQTYTTWAAARDSAHAVSIAVGANYILGPEFTSPNYRLRRAFLSFTMNDLPSASVVDSARFYGNLVNVWNADTSHIVIARGTFVGAVDSLWWNDFNGWAASGAYSMTEYNDSPYWKLNYTESGWKSTLLNAAALDTLEARMGESDTLRLVLVDKRDKLDTAPTLYSMATFSNFYMAIFYGPFGPTSVSAVASPVSVSGVARQTSVSGIP